MKQKIQKDVLQNFSYLPDAIKLSVRTSVWNVGDISKNLRSKANG